MSHLDTLNPAQQEAARHQTGPLLIVAGAGAGKTKTITHRIFNLIQSGVPAESILAITFTNKAAKEMRDRIMTLLGNSTSPSEIGLWPFASQISRGKPFVSTFHSLGVFILRQHGQLIGLDRFFTIYDKDDSLAKVKQAMKLLNIDDKRFEPRKILGAISRQKGNGVNLPEFTSAAGKEFYPKLVATVWAKYEEMLSKAKALDFDDLLLKTVHLLKTNEPVLNFYRDKWQYLHIDEYQDTNAIQYELSQLLAAQHRNICVVGDIDQSIYSWRGADYTNILNFEKDYPEAKVVILEENYRSTQNILQAANDVIKKNKKRKEKNLFTKNKEGEKITMYAGLNEQDEAAYIAQTSFDLIHAGANPEDIAVLYRANFQSRVLEEAFLKLSVPYQVLGTRFYERKEIKDILAFIKAAFNPDDTESVKRIINLPPRGIGQITLEKIFTGEEEKLPIKMQEKIKNFRVTLGAIRGQANSLKPSELIKFIVEHTGIEDGLKKGSEEDQDRLENLKEFASLAVKYDDLSPEEGILQLITDASLVSDQDSLLISEKKGGLPSEIRGAEGQKPISQGVRLMTVHSAKGLEFESVFISGLEQDLFPHAPLANDEKRDDEEERRLFYVALTRAKTKLFLTYAQSRTIFGSRQMTIPSEFLFDIDDSLVSAESSSFGATTNYLDIDF